jgi:geranylgeranyl diphosphate synthase type I
VPAPFPTLRVAPAPGSLQSVGERIDARILSLLDDEVARWTAVDPELGEPLGALRDLIAAGGKRLRPAFCHWAFVGVGGDPMDPRVADAGAALELLHTFALVHDDVMDGSATRRGERTIHVEFDETHRRSSWRGESRRFGAGVAILFGDLAEVFADRLMTAAPPAAFAVWNELKIELNVGQYLDVLGTARGGTDLATARRIARYKSGKYTIERPLHVGAAMAGRLDELEGPLSAYGAPLGEAFQLRDDILGTFGDEARTGKPVGDDLREGKPTPLLAIARERTTGAEADLLDRVGRPDLTTDEIIDIQHLITTSGARAEIETTITALTAEAVAALDTAPISPTAADALRHLAGYVAARDT